jgi:hypothetical protein
MKEMRFIINGKINKELHPEIIQMLEFLDKYNEKLLYLTITICFPIEKKQEINEK